MIKISRHFEDNWRSRVGGSPDPAQVCQILQRALRVQTGGVGIEGSKYPHTLSIYWSPADDLMIKVDPFTGTAVTVMSGAMQRRRAA